MSECGGIAWVKSLLGGEYCTNMAAEASRAIEARFIEPDSVTVKQLPMLTDLDIEKTADTCCYEMGETAHFTITLTNLGPSIATSVLVMDVLPEGLSYDGSTASQGWYDVTSGYWSVGDLASGDDATLEIDAVVNTVGEVCNRAGPDTVCSCNSGSACAAGAVCCHTPSGCFDLQTDPANCGACGWTCPAGTSCQSGVCI